MESPGKPKTTVSSKYIRKKNKELVEIVGCNAQHKENNYTIAKNLIILHKFAAAMGG